MTQVVYLPDGDDFEIEYRAQHDQFPALARAVHQVIFLPGLRRWIERRFGRGGVPVCEFHPQGPPAHRRTAARDSHR